MAQQQRMMIFRNERPENQLLESYQNKKKITIQAWAQMPAKWYENVQEWRITKLAIVRNDYPKVLKQVSGIRFPFLIKIVLWFNKIQSIESMCQIYLPSLKQLNIASNKISSLKPLRKCLLPQLREVITGNGPMIQVQPLVEMYSPILRVLLIELEDNDLVCVDVLPVIKLQSLSIKDLWIQSQQRIKQESFNSAFQRKYIKASVNVQDQENLDGSNYDSN